MDYFFNKITDLGLRRIYKFILKRTIGKYLEDELLVEQLSVKSSEGLITLNDLKLNKDVINEEFCSLLPLRVVEISVNQLNLLLSYQKLLSDGCTFQVDELTIVIEPVDKLDTLNLAINSNCYDKKISSSSVHSDRRTHGVDPNSYENYVVHDIVNPYGDNLAVEDDKGQGLDFIAHWVEVIVAKLKVQVRKVVLVVKASNTSSSSYNSGSSSKSQDLRIELFGIKYFNTDPSVFSTSESSVELSSKLSAGQASGIAKELGARKIVTLDGISIAFANNSVSSNGENHVDPVNNFPEGNEFIVSRKNTQPLLHCPEGVNLRVRLDQLHSKLEGVDCDLTFPSLKLCFDASSVLSLLQILSQYSVAKSPAGSPSRVPYSDGANLSNSQIGRSVLESVLDSDKVLDWIVEQELRSKKVMNSSSKNVAGVSYVGDELDDIDFAAIIYKIKKVLMLFMLLSLIDQ